MAHICPSDSSFGPAIDGSCRGGFDLTLLFEDSVLGLLPHAILLVVAPLRLSTLIKKTRAVSKWEGIGVTKLVLSTVYVISSITLLVLWATTKSQKSSTSIASAALEFLVSLLVIFLSRYEHTRAVKPSHLLQLFLLLLLSCDVVRLRTLYLVEYPSSILATASIRAILICGLLVIESVNKRRLLKRDEDKNLPVEETIGLFTKRFFWYLNGLFKTGYRKVLTPGDLMSIDRSLVSDDIRSGFRKYWQIHSQNKVRAPLTRVIWSVLWIDILISVIPRVLYLGTTLSQPFLIAALIRFVQKTPEINDISTGYGLLGAFALNYIFLAIFSSWYTQSVARFKVKLRGGLISLIYERSLHVHLKDINVGSATVLMNVDVERIIGFSQHIHEFWALIASTGIAVYILYLQLGAAFVAPLVVVVGATIVSSALGNRVKPHQLAWMAATQKRVTSIAYAAGNMKGIRMLGLNETVLATLTGLREREMFLSREVRKLIIWVLTISNVIFQLATFAAYTAFAIIAIIQGRILDAETLFTSLSALKLFTSPLVMVLQFIPSLFNAIGCLQRVQVYLSGDSSPEDTVRQATEPSNNGDFELRNISSQRNTPCNKCEAAITIQNGTFEIENGKALISGINLEIPRKGLTMIIGRVAAGKSVLLQSIAGELSLTSGTIRKDDCSIGYCAQSAWLRNLSLRANIIGEQEYDADWYNFITWACGLHKDFSEMKEGDTTLVGSKGVSLSGGQKNRIALARAIYCRESLYLIDDILSGLDRTTEKLVFDRVFGRRGVLRNHTVVLATHSTRWLPAANHVIVMDKGRIIDEGSYDTLAARPKISDELNLSLEPITPTKDGDDDGYTAGPVEVDSTKTQSNNPPTAEDDSSHRRDGDFGDLLYYLSSVGKVHGGIYVVLMITFVTLVNIQFIWLKWWADSDQNSNAVMKRNMGIFAAITFITIAAGAAWLAHFALVFMSRSALGLHAKQLNALMRASYSFLVRTDVGQIANRFSADMVLIDMPLQNSWINSTSILCELIANIILVVIATPPVGAMIPFLALVSWMLQRVYLRTSRQIRLMDLEAKAPLCTQFLETLAGIVTIRAFGWSKSYRQKNDQLLDESQVPFYLLHAIQNWLKLVLELIVAGVVIVTVGLAIALRRKIDPGYLGLALVSLMDLGLFLRELVTAWTDLETSLSAVSRVRRFAATAPPEENTDTCVTPPENWPTEGSVHFSNLVAAYSEEGLPVLRGIDLEIKAGEKAGICGRTGSGKSSLVSTLFGLLHNQSGKIFIDNVATETISLSTLRAQTIALPQEPFFLPGTVRDNLLPWKEEGSRGVVMEDQLLTALGEVDLLNKLEAMATAGGFSSALDVSLDDLDSVFSHGEKQLFCLARAVLMEGKIVVLDEATSSVDKATDSLMQVVFRSAFATKTIIAIAHRLDTILDFDRIVVMEAGKIVEVGSPEALLKDKRSVFRTLYDEQGEK